MKLTFKDLKQQKFNIEAEPSDTISDVKAKIFDDKGSGWEPAQQKLIYSGKILQDGATVGSYNIEEKGFIVCMISKPKAVPAASSQATPSTPAPATAPAQTPAAPAAPVQNTSSTPVAPATPSPAPQSTETTSRSANDPSSLTMGSARAEAIESMEAMGFERPEIERAMRAAFFNPDRAVEYLINGIPENIQQESSGRSLPTGGSTTTTPAATGATAAAPATPVAGGNAPAPAGDEAINLFDAAAQAGQGNRGAGGLARGPGAGGAGGAGPDLGWLRNNPQFQQLRQVVQQQPQMLEPILQQVGAGNPQLAQLIAQQPEEFLQLLAEDNDGDTPLPPGAQAISVTEEEREAIERLCRLGFERDLVIQAYFACDKNEELAANFLFDQPDDDGDGA